MEKKGNFTPSVDIHVGTTIAFTSELGGKGEAEQVNWTGNFHEGQKCALADNTHKPI